MRAVDQQQPDPRLECGILKFLVAALRRAMCGAHRAGNFNVPGLNSPRETTQWINTLDEKSARLKIWTWRVINGAPPNQQVPLSEFSAADLFGRPPLRRGTSERVCVCVCGRGREIERGTIAPNQIKKQPLQAGAEKWPRCLLLSTLVVVCRHGLIILSGDLYRYIKISSEEEEQSMQAPDYFLKVVSLFGKVCCK